MDSKLSRYREAIKDDESLAVFLRNMSDFEQYFCDLMAKGLDFKLVMEVHGNKGELLHVKVEPKSWDRPAGVEKRVEDKKKGGG